MNLKESGKYEEENLVVIEGNTWDEIFSNYFGMISDKGYNMTVHEACDYISCSYTYFITRLVNKIKHIRINRAARKILFNKIQEYEEYRALFSKRILLSRDDFYRCVKSDMFVEQQYIVLNIDDVEESIVQEIDENLKKYYESKRGRPKSSSVWLFEDVINSNITKKEPVKHKLSEDKILPSKLLSVRQLREHFNVGSDVQVYRMIEKYGAKKYTLYDFVRYDINDFKADANKIIKVDYASFLEMKKTADFLSTITNKVLVASRGLSNLKNLKG